MMGKHRFYVLFGMAVVPIILAWALFFTGWRSQHTTNQGQLIHPPIASTDLAWYRPHHALHHASLKHHWQLMWMHRGACDHACRASIHQLVNVRAATGRQRGRLEVNVVSIGMSPTDEFDRWLHQHHPFVTHRLLSLEHFQTYMKPYWSAKHQGQAFVEDPRGYLILAYPMKQWGKPLLHDVKHLLRVSRIG